MRPVVLVVEDDPELAARWAQMVRPFADCKTVHTLTATLTWLTQVRYQGVLLDIGLPDVTDRPTVVRSVCAAAGDAKVLIVTGHTDSEALLQGLGAWGILRKPIAEQTVVATMRAMLGLQSGDTTPRGREPTGEHPAVALPAEDDRLAGLVVDLIAEVKSLRAEMDEMHEREQAREQEEAIEAEVNRRIAERDHSQIVELPAPGIIERARANPGATTAIGGGAAGTIAGIVYLLLQLFGGANGPAHHNHKPAAHQAAPVGSGKTHPGAHAGGGAGRAPSHPARGATPH